MEIEDGVERDRVDVSAMRFIDACPGRPGDGKKISLLREIVNDGRGSTVEIGWPYCEMMVLGDRDYFGVYVDLERLKALPCVDSGSDLMFVGLVRPRKLLSGEGRGFGVIVSSEGTIYVYSFGTRLLYVVSRNGFHDVVNHRRGLRAVFELYDVPPLDARDESLEFDYDCSPMLANVMDDGCDYLRVADFVLSFSRLTCDSRGEPEGYFMFGNEEHLNLGQYVPMRLIYCLKVAGYRVLGQGYRLSVILYDRECQVFVLMRNAMLMKVANTIRGFVRDRLRCGLDVRRRAFDSDVTGNVCCVGDIVTFPCDVRYVLQDDDWFHDRIRDEKDSVSESSGRRESDVFVL